jgi:uncharacterized repeat protein (TIGR03803 family)
MKRMSVFLVLILGGWLLTVPNVGAATFTNIHIFSLDDFSAGPNPQRTNSDGITPDGCIISGNTLYGTASGGGLYGYGTIFRVNLDGTQFTNLFNFDEGAYDPVLMGYPNNKGATPNPGLALIGNTLYGTTHSGGTNLAGSIFRINTDGSGFATIHQFHFLDGQGTQHGLVLYSNLLYGTTVLGGSNGFGNIFTLDPSSGTLSFPYQFTNEITPNGGLLVTSNAIYGFGARGGISNNGVIYRVESGYSILYNFTGAIRSDPESTPVLSGNTIYGTTVTGGVFNNGNVFRIDTDGSNYTNLYSFTPNGGANIDGSYPYNYTGLVLSGDKLYGTTSGSGSAGQGTVFQINTDGSGFAVLKSFTYPEGANPEDLVIANGILYGGTFWGVQGVSLGNGAVFAIAVQPTLNITNLANRAVLRWSDPSFSLGTSTNVTGAYTNIMGATSPYTNVISGPQRFFRLQGN